MLVVDLGFSAAKWVYGERKGIIRSCYRKDRYEGVSYQGEKYIVGDRALLDSGSSYIRTLEEIEEFYPLFVGVSALRADVREKCSLVIGLPYSVWKQKYGEFSKKMSAVLKKVTISDKTFEFSELFIFPQGLGGVKHFLKTSKEKCPGNVLGVDVGFNTVIYTLYSVDEQELLTGHTFYRKGVYELATEMLYPEIQRYVGSKPLTPIEIDCIMRTGYIQHGFERIDVRPEIQRAVEAYVRDLLRLVIEDLKARSNISVFSTVLFFGGGAYLVRDRVRSKNIDIVFLDEPEFANALGFRDKALELLEAKDEG